MKKLKKVLFSHLYNMEFVCHNIPGRLPAGSVLGASIRIKNTGRLMWQLHHPEGKRVDLVVLYDNSVCETHNMPCSEVRSGEEVTVHFVLAPLDAGSHTIQIDLVQQNVTRFSDIGAAILRIDCIAYTNTSKNAQIYAAASRINPWYYQPTRGIEKSSDGRFFPLFVQRAKGCHIWDLNNRKYIDYVMGWGCSLLGYADDRIQKALVDVMDSAPVLPFPHVLEMEVAEMLTEDFPCAEMVVFGKNGSDVCTVAARLARVFTGKKIILFCGYHGWQDFWAEHLGFVNTGIPDRSTKIIHRFNFNDIDDFIRLYQLYKKDLAAVFIEPSGPGESIQGPVQDADINFLTQLAKMARDAGALLIYDEIVTGYRYPTGSVQKATGVIPDLTCLGKAIASGMPLSALVGRAEIFRRSMHNTNYGPTFKGEIYSFAAAKAAIQIYRSEPVAEHVWNYGKQLREGINRICKDIGIAAECMGPPFRMSLTFFEQDEYRLRLKRTLYQQELLKAGLITYNSIMLPSYSHNEQVLELTLDAIKTALNTVNNAEQQDNYDKFIEIPLL